MSAARRVALSALMCAAAVVVLPVVLVLVALSAFDDIDGN